MTTKTSKAVKTATTKATSTAAKTTSKAKKDATPKAKKETAEPVVPTTEATATAEPIKTNATKVTDLKMVDPRNIVVVEGFNERKDMGDLDLLLESIVSEGLQIPLRAAKVRGEDKWELVDGHRRLAAILMGLGKGIDMPYVPVVPFVGSSEDRFITQLITGTGAKPLNELEQAEVVKRLITFGYKVEELAKKIGKSVPQLYNLQVVANMPKKIKNRIAEGKITANTVVHISRHEKDEKKQVSLVEAAIKKADARVKALGSTAVAKATPSDVVSLKSKSIQQKLVETFRELQSNGVNNDKVKLLEKVLTEGKDASVEQMVQFFI